MGGGKLPVVNEQFWLKRARREALRFNLAWILQALLPWVIALGLGAAVLILALRTAGVSELFFVWVFVGSVVLVGLGSSWYFSRRKFLSQADALARLDADLRLNNRLIAASHGVGEWPASLTAAALALQWNWRALVWPPLLSVFLLLAALWIPVPALAAAKSIPRVEPSSWTATQKKIEALREEEVVQPEAIEELQQALDALRKQPGEQWFRHESLEAGDHLQAQTEQSMSALQKNLQAALTALEAARQIEQSQVAALSDPINDALQQSLSGMEVGALPLDEKLLKELKKMDASKIRQLSAEQYKELADRLKKGAGTGGKEGFEKDGLLALIYGSDPGSGGVNRGPGAAPLTLKDNETQLGTTKTETLQNEDLSHAALGDLMGLGAGEHRVDKANWQGPEQGGGMVSPGSGGEAVWDQAATPAEQEALRRFFK